MRLDLDTRPAPAALCRALRDRQAASLWLDGSGFTEGWSCGQLIADAPRVVRFDSACSVGWTQLESSLTERRHPEALAQTGIALLLPFEASEISRRGAGAAQALAFHVDRSIAFDADGRAAIVGRPGSEADEFARRVERISGEQAGAQTTPARISAAPSTSLPRPAYLTALDSIRRRIAAGDIYQANLCQRIEAPYEGDELALYEQVRDRTPAPRSAFLAAPGLTLASLSPETFVRGRLGGTIETFPIKGTRAREATADADRAAARALLASEKDRAELLMIVDLQRNDLGRVCRVGSVETPVVAGLHSFAAVHHLMAHVRGRLRPDLGLSDLMQAVFPGGSITGAPKRSAIEILRELEPVARNEFTGSLFWFADDGSFDSSILIRTIRFDGRTAQIGAGGGIVADSDPEMEWDESNHKAAALAEALGFHPQELS